MQFGIDMAKAVLHMHSNNFKHTDIAARNFLLEERENDDGTHTPQKIVFKHQDLMTDKHWDFLKAIVPDGSLENLFRPQRLSITDFGLSRPVEVNEI